MAQRKFLSYVILPNFVYQNQYNKCSLNVFNDQRLNWEPVLNFSEHWYQFPDYLCYNYSNMRKVLKLVMNEMLEEDCSYHRDKFGLFSILFLEMNMGETLFLKYLTATESSLIVSKNDLENTKLFM
jgi:hypothetical protein